MAERAPFIDQLKARWNEGKFVCVGLDPDPARLKHSLEYFLRKIVDSTANLVCAYKPNIAFFESQPKGDEALFSITHHIHSSHPDVSVIGDIKRADIGNTNRGYAQMAFERYRFDAITTNPYFGADTFPPFLNYEGRGLIILCRTANPGSQELQNMPIWLPQARDEGLVTRQEYDDLGDLIGKPAIRMYELVAFFAAHRWSKNTDNLALVVGATHPEAFAPVRKLAGDLPFLIPGIGTQGGDLEKTLKYAPDSQGQGMIINSGSAIIFASTGSDFAEAARAATLKLHTQIQQLRS